MDSTIRGHLNRILDEINALQQVVSQADEFTVLEDLKLAVYATRKVFERTKEINNEKPSSIQEIETNSP